MRVDGHQHFWKADRGDYHWMDSSVSILCCDYLPSDLRPHLAKHGIEKTILVQAAQTVAETDFLLELAAQHSFIAGVVGWLDMESMDFARQFDLYRKNPKFIGLRPMLQDLPDPAWIVRPQILKSLRLVADADFPFEFLTYTQHLPYVLQALEAAPQIRAAIDHISKPEIKGGKVEPWKQLMAQAARHNNLYCKLSGMVTEADPLHWSAEDLRPYIEHIVDCFGWDRVIFGSDWPVCLLAGTYDQVVEALIEVLRPRMDRVSEEKLFGMNAAHFYKLTPEAR
jgi:L-fuconolactonase